MEYIEVTGKSVEEAITNACTKLGIPSSKLDYEVIEKGSSGLFGLFNSKPAKIKAREKSEETDDSVKEEAKAEVKTETKAEAKTEVKKEAKPETKKEFKPEPKKEVKAEVKTEVKRESESDVMDDNSFIWWLVTRAAVRSTDFHKEYSAILDGSIAPIPT